MRSPHIICAVYVCTYNMCMSSPATCRPECPGSRESSPGAPPACIYICCIENIRIHSYLDIHEVCISYLCVSLSRIIPRGSNLLLPRSIDTTLSHTHLSNRLADTHNRSSLSLTHISPTDMWGRPAAASEAPRTMGAPRGPLTTTLPSLAGNECPPPHAAG